MSELQAAIRYGDLDLTSYPYAWEFGGDLGKPELVTQALEQQLQDGEVVSADRSSNREIVVSVLVEAADLAAQADAESVLALECAKARNTLTYDPGDGVARPTVFDTFVAEMAFDRDDDMEQNGLRRWKLTIPALPFARSDTAITVDVPSQPSPAPVVIDNGSATTGWTSNPTPVTTSGGKVLSGAGAMRTNLMPNPSFESNTTGWSSLATLARTNVQQAAGSYSLQVTAGSYGTQTQVWHTNTTVPVTAGQTYTVQAKSRAATVGRPLYVRVDWFNSSGGLVGSPAVGGGTATSTTTGWVTNSLTATAPTGATSVRVTLQIDGVVLPVGEVHYIDAVMVEQAASAGTYFDGSSAPGSGADYAWTGAADNSTSQSFPDLIWLRRSGLAVSMTGTPYVVVTAGFTGHTLAQYPSLYTLLVNGTSVPLLKSAVVSSAQVMMWFDATGIATLNTVELQLPHPYVDGTLQIDEVARSNSTSTGTGRQQSRQIQVAGSARAAVSLSVLDPAATALGSTLVYTTSEDRSAAPPLKKYLRTGPTVTTDGTTVSGSTINLTDASLPYFDIPSVSVPEAGCLLVARVKSPTTATVNLGGSVISSMGGAGVGDSQTFSVSVALTANVWTVVPIALVVLPPTRVGVDGAVTVQLSGSNNTLLDEAWLFDMDHGRLTWVEVTASKRLWLDAASVDNPEPSILVGNNVSRSDQVGAGTAIRSFGLHEFVPPTVNVFTVTTGSAVAAMQLVYFPRWHTHVGSLS